MLSIRSILLWVGTLLATIFFSIAALEGWPSAFLFFAIGLLIAPPVRAWLKSTPLKVVTSTVFTSLAVCSLGAVGLILSGVYEQRQRDEAQFLTNPKLILGSIENEVTNNNLSRAQIELDRYLEIAPTDKRLLALQEVISKAQMNQVLQDKNFHKLNDVIINLKSRQLSNVSSSVEEKYFEVLYREIDDLAGKGQFSSAEERVMKSKELFPDSPMPDEILGSLKLVKEAYFEEKRQEKLVREAQRNEGTNGEKRSNDGYPSSGSLTTSGVVTQVDSVTGNVYITGFSPWVGTSASTSITVNGTPVRNEGDLIPGDRCRVVKESTDLYARNLICSR